MAAQYPYQDGVAGAPRLTVVSILDHTRAVFMEKPKLFLALSFLAYFPSLAMAGAVAEFVGAGTRLLLLSLAFTIVEIVVQGAISYGVYRTLRGDAATARDSISRGLARGGALLAAALFVRVGSGVAMLLLVAPGLILACMWAVTAPVCVVEGKGPVASMSRSAELTRGYRWWIFGAKGVAMLLVQGVQRVAPLIFFHVVNPAAAVFLVALIVVIPSAFDSVMTAVIYYDLRMAKEGMPVDRLASVFD